MKRERAQDLRAAVDRLPLGTRQNMLKGLDTHNIIVGADGNIRGGRCPMMAASIGSSKVTGKPFARAWDAYGGARISRPATRHELQTLRTMLQASIAMETDKPVDLTAAISTLSVPTPAKNADSPPVLDLQAAIAAHMASKERSSARERAKVLARESARPEQPDTGERDRTEELEGRHGWAWLRPFRRYDDFERAVHQLEEAERAGLAAYASGAAGPEDEEILTEGDRQPVGTPSGGY